eukprot:TRINITY_DN13620_c0_g1_i3.p1 TRINITY_DN13620_c0_g1~~TRINITY_DN13620_c0_g1_i3.p1  ORF type:complete len:202 (+),score=8.66 TRINITY_DN13620_c0_g1_i3:63-668(+)
MCIRDRVSTQSTWLSVSRDYLQANLPNFLDIVSSEVSVEPSGAVFQYMAALPNKETGNIKIVFIAPNSSNTSFISFAVYKWTNLSVIPSWVELNPFDHLDKSEEQVARGVVRFNGMQFDASSINLSHTVQKGIKYVLFYVQLCERPFNLEVSCASAVNGPFDLGEPWMDDSLVDEGYEDEALTSLSFRFNSCLLILISVLI